MRKKKEVLIQFNKSYILEASKQLFLKKGIEKTTVDDIAKLADCSKSTIYVYFKSKDEIFNHIVCEYMILLKNSIQDSIEHTADFESCYFSICVKLTEFQQQYPMYFESILAEISVNPEDFAEHPILEEIHHTGDEINKMLEEFLRKAMIAEKIRADLDPLQTVFTLWGSICGVILLADKKKKYFESDLKLEQQRFLDYSFQLIFNGLLQ